MELSKYNLNMETHDGNMMLFNTYTKAQLLISKDSYEAYRVVDDQSDDSIYRKYGFYIESAQEQLNSVISNQNKKTHFSKTLNITLKITDDCNMACEYCFNGRSRLYENIGISDEVLSNLESKITDYVKVNNITSMSVDYFGGEPTLFKSQIIKFQKFIRTISEIRTYTKLTTNGTLIDESFISEMVNLGLDDVQITIDGPKSITDLSRYLRNGESSYDLIVNNIHLMSKFMKTEIIVRVNIDGKNVNSIYKLIDDLVLLNCQEKIIIHLAKIYYRDSEKKECISDSSLIEIYNYAKLNSIPVLDQWENNVPYFEACGVRGENSYVINYTGDIYKCHLMPIEKKRSIGNILDNQSLKDCASTSTIKLMDECYDCEYLPLCNGGCYYKAFDNDTLPYPYCEKSDYEQIIKIMVSQYNKERK